MRRVFFLTDMKCKIGGGGGGVNYRLMLANEKYHIFPEAIFVFSDKIIISPGGDQIQVPWDADGQAQIEDFERLDELFDFSERDVFIAHGLEIFFLLKMASPNVKKTIVVYHGQGGLYYEKVCYGEAPDKEYEETYKVLTQYALNESNYFAFPSKGAMKAFIDTQPGMDQYVNEAKCKILYNGCACTLNQNYDDHTEILQKLSKTKGKIFVTVAALVEQKGVERLPAFFEGYGECEEDYFWVIIGDGVKRDELLTKIHECGIEEHVLWERNRVDNALILNIYCKSDFYILAHRFSIFDFATIEAMHMGCIPVLSPVGGNLEMIENGNGYFLDESLSGKMFYDWMVQQDLDLLKKTNEELASTRFSDNAMLKGYYDLSCTL